MIGVYKMILKEFLEKNGITIYSLAKATEIPYSTLNDIVNVKISSDEIKYGVIRRIASGLNTTVDQVVQMIDNSIPSLPVSYAVIRIMNKSYYLEYRTPKKTVLIYLCKANALNLQFVDAMAELRINEFQRKELIDETWINSFS